MPLINVDMSGTREKSQCIPAGEYPARVEDAEVRTAKRSGVPYLTVKFQLLAPEWYGRTVFENFYLWHPNASWGKQKFRMLRMSCGLDPDTAGATEELVGHCVVAVVTVRDRKDGGGKENSMKTFKPWSRPVAAMPAQTPAPGVSAGTPWE